MASMTWVPALKRWRVRWRATNRITHEVFQGSRTFTEKPDAARCWAEMEAKEKFWRRGVFEEALALAWMTAERNHRDVPLCAIEVAFKYADRQRLLKQGDPLPKENAFTVYRGVAGKGPARRVRGLSWTGSLSNVKPDEVYAMKWGDEPPQAGSRGEEDYDPLTHGRS